MIYWLLIADPQVASWPGCIMASRGFCMMRWLALLFCPWIIYVLYLKTQRLLSIVWLCFKFLVCEKPLFLKLVKLVLGLVFVSSQTPQGSHSIINKISSVLVKLYRYNPSRSLFQKYSIDLILQEFFLKDWKGMNVSSSCLNHIRYL